MEEIFTKYGEVLALVLFGGMILWLFQFILLILGG